MEKWTEKQQKPLTLYGIGLINQIMDFTLLQLRSLSAFPFSSSSSPLILTLLLPLKLKLADQTTKTSSHLVFSALCAVLIIVKFGVLLRRVDWQHENFINRLILIFLCSFTAQNVDDDRKRISQTNNTATHNPKSNNFHSRSRNFSRFRSCTRCDVRELCQQSTISVTRASSRRVPMNILLLIS